MNKDQTKKTQEKPKTDEQEIDDLINELETQERDIEIEEQGFLPKSKEVFSWEADEFTQYERSKVWYIAGAIFIVSMVVIAIVVFNNNFAMALVFILIGIVAYIYSKKKPRRIKVRMLHGGIEVDDVYYDYDDMEYFWIFYNKPPQDAYISIKRIKKYLPFLHIPIDDADPAAIRKELRKHIDENKHQEDFATVVERILKI
ncbi:MAG: hypothetical protein GF332_01830 [Candidatus Moranbacteria bacterium]|nr:hypothetical protein [Candidatus Moranbacteria bacterium]